MKEVEEGGEVGEVKSRMHLPTSPIVTCYPNQSSKQTHTSVSCLSVADIRKTVLIIKSQIFARIAHFPRLPHELEVGWLDPELSCEPLPHLI